LANRSREVLQPAAALPGSAAGQPISVWNRIATTLRWNVGAFGEAGALVRTVQKAIDTR
jgi:hypothetical protein